MTPTSAGPSLEAASSDDTARWTPRLVAMLIALIWPTQLLAAAGILGANATASVAQSFHASHVAWFRSDRRPRLDVADAVRDETR